MATSTQAERPNKVDITDAGPSRKKIRIEIPAETVAETLNGTVDTLLVEAEIPGFRRGRAPRRLVEKKFGSVIRKQSKEQLVSQAYSRAVEEHKLRVVGNPTAEQLAKADVVDGQPLTIEIEVEVVPEFELPALEGIPVKKPLLEVTDEMVAKELEKLAIQEGSLEERQAPEPGDYLTGHARLEGSNGKVYFESDGIVVQVPTPDKKGRGMIVGLVVEDFATQMGLPAPGQTRVIKTKGPENHENEEMRGLDLTVTYTPARCDRILPASLGELALRFGLENDEALRTAMRERLRQRVLVEQVAVMRQQLCRTLAEQTKMDLPERLTAQQAGRSLERRRLELMYRGVDPLKIEENLAELRKASAQAAAHELKVFFILDRAAEKLNVRVTEQEINGRIAQIAMERNERPEQLRQQLINSGQVSAVFQQIREHKTLDAILQKAAVTEVSPADFNKDAAAAG